MFPGTAVCSRSVKGLYEKVSRRHSPLKSDPLWEDMLSATSHRLVVHRWGERGAGGAQAVCQGSRVTLGSNSEPWRLEVE